MSHYKDIATMLIGCWLVRIFTEEERDLKSFIKLCIYFVAFNGLLKFAILEYSLVSGVPLALIIDRISKAFGVELMSMEVGEVGVRLQFVSDPMLPMCLFSLSCLRKRLSIGGLPSVFMMAMLVFSAIMTFSRFLWAAAALGLVMGIVVAKKDKVHLVYVATVSLATAYFFDLISTMVNLRIAGDANDSSDTTRADQKRALHSFFMESPFWGHGLGSHSTISIRQVDLPYNYELQVPALLGQVGVVGALALFGLLVNYYRKAFSLTPFLYQASVFAMLCMFLISGFFNPTLITSSAAASFGLIFVLAKNGSLQP
jgi:O-antigen ligase